MTLSVHFLHLFSTFLSTGRTSRQKTFDPISFLPSFPILLPWTQKCWIVTMFMLLKLWKFFNLADNDIRSYISYYFVCSFEHRFGGNQLILWLSYTLIVVLSWWRTQTIYISHFSAVSYSTFPLYYNYTQQTNVVCVFRSKRWQSGNLKIMRSNNEALKLNRKLILSS